MTATIRKLRVGINPAKASFARSPTSTIQRTRYSSKSELDQDAPPEIDFTALMLQPVEGTFLLPIKGFGPQVEAKKAQLLEKHGQGKLRMSIGPVVKYEIEKSGVLHFTKIPNGWVARITKPVTNI